MKYILGVFGVIVLMLLIVILIVRGGSDEPKDDNQAASSQVVLSNYINQSATFSFKNTGEVTSNEERRAVLITVSSQERVIEVLDGYNDSIAIRQVFANNTNAYNTFLNALDAAGFSSQRDAGTTNSTGVCPFGNHYEYKLQDGSNQILLTWGTSCAKKQGSFGGHAPTVRELFQEQIPNYSDIVADVDL